MASHRPQLEMRKQPQDAAVTPEAQLPGEPGRGALDLLEAGTMFWSQGL